VHNDEFRRAIEAIKLRAPIEDVVRERVSSLKKAGALWVACCPFHDEKTPSFKVDPRRGTWHCFGSCASGGDQISFIERADNLSFLDALEILAARTGVELPKAARQRGAGDDARDVEFRESLALLERAQAFYATQLDTPEGRAAERYLSERGLTQATSQTFGVGYAPASGQAFVEFARRHDIPIARCEAVGLARRNDQGRPYDFFRGRLMIPIRDVKGQTVGFGARRLADDDASGPKYVNTQETAFFHKGRLVYALDRAISAVRKGGHLVLVEGYTDVMAAHQAGVTTVVAVLGTSTTDEHAALVRKTGARRVSLVFDGDEAGHKAAARALHGLLPLDVEIDVVSLTGGQDPCDLLIREGASAFAAQLELARSWFDHVTAPLASLRGVELSRSVDRVLELLSRLSKPVHRESLAADLARRIDVPVEALREQWRAQHGGRRVRVPADEARPVEVRADAPAVVAADPLLVRAFEDIVGAILLDASLVPMARPYRDQCPSPNLARVFDTVLELYADENALIDAGSVLNQLGDDEARHCVVPIVERAGAADSPRSLLDGQLRYLRTRALKLKNNGLVREVIDEERRASDRGGIDAAVHDPHVIELSKRTHENLRSAVSRALTN
jgi:DNA primase